MHMIYTCVYKKTHTTWDKRNAEASEGIIRQACVKSQCDKKKLLLRSRTYIYIRTALKEKIPGPVRDAFSYSSLVNKISCSSIRSTNFLSSSDNLQEVIYIQNYRATIRVRNAVVHSVSGVYIFHMYTSVSYHVTCLIYSYHEYFKNTKTRDRKTARYARTAVVVIWP